MTHIRFRLPSAAFPLRWLAIRLAAALAFGVAADWLMVRGMNLSVLVVLALVATLVAVFNPVRIGGQRLLLAVAGLAVSLAPLAVDANEVSVLLAMVGVGVFALALTGQPLRYWPLAGGRALLLPLAGPVRLLIDLLRVMRLATARRGSRTPRAGRLAGWLVPVLLLAVFLVLFNMVNPVLERWLGLLALIRVPDIERFMVWSALAVLVWPLVHLRVRRTAQAPARGAATGAVHPSGYFGTVPVLRALVLCNGLFALQTGMDVAYLWGGLALPPGVTYAAYAHRGAYALILTVLIAAAFILVAARPGGAVSQSRLVRTLVLLWIGQNLALTLSAILRLKIYIEVYQLTYWRIAAAVWFVLVIFGLLSVVVLVVRGKPLVWLVNRNAAAFAVAMLAGSLANLPALTAHYNITHSREVTGKGPALDVAYLVSLGPQAIPVIDEYLGRIELDLARPPADRNSYEHLVESRNRTAVWFPASMTDWRRWSLRDAHLARYLAGTREAKVLTR